MDKATRNLLIFFAVLFTAVVVLLAVFIPRHTEAYLLHACARSDGSADYAGDCFDVTWKDLPIIIGADPAFSPTEDQLKVLKENVAAANRQLKAEFYQLAAEGETPQVVVQFNQAFDETLREPGGETMHWFENSLAVRSEIRIVNVALMQDLYAVLYHEMGHGIGLADDDYAESAMCVPVSDGSMYSDYDVRHLRETYRTSR